MIYICTVEELISHIEFLLLKHDCVLVPRLGGFILNREPAVFDGKNILPPSIRIGFNADLKFQDGLLAESFMKYNSIPYDKACEKIDEIVKHIKTDLQKKQTLSFGNLGTFILKDDILSFESGTFLHPSVFGYSSLPIVPLKSAPISFMADRKRKKQGLKYTIAGVVSAAAIAACLVFAPSIKDGLFRNSHLSGFLFNDKAVYGLSLEKNTPTIPSSSDVFKEIAANYIPKEEPQVSQAIVENAKPGNTKKYYIIVAGDTNEQRVQRLLSQFRQGGFSNAEVVMSSDRMRISVASFENKQQAESYLLQFRKNNPKHNDAWLYTKRS
ncbi:MAG: hypothetical protein ACLVKO_07400 [Dysgonomonas sp.]